jgi:hypothetical protein
MLLQLLPTFATPFTFDLETWTQRPALERLDVAVLFEVGEDILYACPGYRTPLCDLDGGQCAVFQQRRVCLCLVRIQTELPNARPDFVASPRRCPIAVSPHTYHWLYTLLELGTRSAT